MKKVFEVLLVVGLVLGLCACGNSQEETSAAEEEVVENKYNLVTPGVLVVSMSTDFAPMEFVDLTKEGQDKYVGSDVELAKYIAEKLGLTLEIKAMEFDASQAAVANGLVDVSISAYSYTSDRAASYLLSKNYYVGGDEDQVVMVAKENEAIYTSLASLDNADVQIAAQNGALQQELVKEQLPNAELKAIDDLNAAYDLLGTGTYDAVAVAKTVAETLVGAYPDKYAIVPEYFDASKYSGNHVLINIDNTALCEAIDGVIDTMPEGQYASWESDAYDYFLSLGDQAAEAIVAEED